MKKRTEANVGRSGTPASPGRERLSAVVLSSQINGKN